jgi:hypothetical protein
MRKACADLVYAIDAVAAAYENLEGYERTSTHTEIINGCEAELRTAFKKATGYEYDDLHTVVKS